MLPEKACSMIDIQVLSIVREYVFEEWNSTQRALAEVSRKPTGRWLAENEAEAVYASGLAITIWRVGEPYCILELLNKLKEKHMNKKYIVRLTAEERAHLHQMLSAGKAAARKLLHARILLKADASPEGPGWTDEHISEALDVSTTTIGRVRQHFVEQSLTAALERRLPCGHRLRRLDGEAEAHLIALACSPAPSGHVHWTIRLLADK